MSCRTLATATGSLAEAQQRAAAAAQTAHRADDRFVAAQQAVQRLSEERSAADECHSAALACVEQCNVDLVAAESVQKASQEILKVATPYKRSAKPQHCFTDGTLKLLHSSNQLCQMAGPMHSSKEPLSVRLDSYKHCTLFPFASCIMCHAAGL